LSLSLSLAPLYETRGFNPSDEGCTCHRRTLPPSFSLSAAFHVATSRGDCFRRGSYRDFDLTTLDLFPPLEPRAARKKHGGGALVGQRPPQSPTLLLIVSIVANLVPVSLRPVRNIADIQTEYAWISILSRLALCLPNSTPKATGSVLRVWFAGARRLRPIEARQWICFDFRVLRIFTGGTNEDRYSQGRR